MGIDFHSKSNYGDQYKKTKTRTFEESIIKNFHGKKMPEEKIACTCIPIIMLDSILYPYGIFIHIILKCI